MRCRQHGKDSRQQAAASSQNMKSENCSPFYFVSVRCTKLYSMRRRKQINISGPREHRLPNTTAELGFVHFGSGGGGCNGCSVATVNAMIMSYRALHTNCDCKWHIESMRLIRLMNWLVSHCLQDKQSSSVLWMSVGRDADQFKGELRTFRLIDWCAVAEAGWCTMIACNIDRLSEAGAGQ